MGSPEAKIVRLFGQTLLTGLPNSTPQCRDYDVHDFVVKWCSVY